MKLRFFQFSSIAVLLLTAQILQAQGVLLVEQETRDGKSTTNQIQLDKNHMRAESHNTGDDMAVVFDGGAQVIRMINLDKKNLQRNRQGSAGAASAADGRRGRADERGAAEDAGANEEYDSRAAGNGRTDD